MKCSCREAALDGFVHKTLEAARARPSMRVQLSQYGRISAAGLAERARREGLVAHTFGEYIVVLGAPRK